MIRFRKTCDDGEHKYKTLNLSSFLSLKDETQLSMNQALLNAVNKLAIVKKDKNLQEKIKTLNDLTYEEDGAVKGKLIMNVQPTTDEDDEEVLKLPEEVTSLNDKLQSQKDNLKKKITNSKQR